MRLKGAIVKLGLLLLIIFTIIGCGGGTGNGPGGSLPDTIVGYVYLNTAGIVQILNSSVHPSDYSPAANAEVTLDTPYTTIITGSDGKFSFSNVTAGVRTLVVKPAGSSNAFQFTCTPGVGTFTPVDPNSGSIIIRDVPNGTEVGLNDLVGKDVVFIWSTMDVKEGIYSTSAVQEGTITFNPSIGSVSEESRRPVQWSASLHPMQYGPRQIAIDRKMREIERGLLKTEKRSFSYQKSQQPQAEITKGYQRKFWISLDAGATEITATCQKLGSHCAIFVDNSYLNDANLTASVINSVANYFDNVVYPTNTSVFGNAEDTDNESRILIVFSPLDRYGGSLVVGYFYAIDKFANDPTHPQLKYSNECDAFYLTIPQNDYELGLFNGTLPHEFQHMINFDRHVVNNAPSVEMLWVNEGLSELADFLCTQNSASRRASIKEYLKDPDSLTWWDYDPTYTLKNYCASRLFALYLYDRFYLSGGKQDLIKNLVNNVLVGVKNVEEVTGVAFNQLFKDWAAALYLSDTGKTTDPRYQYRSINLHTEGLEGLQPSNTFDTGGSMKTKWSSYAPRMVKLILSSSSASIKYTGSSSLHPMGGLIIAD